MSIAKQILQVKIENYLTNVRAFQTDFQLVEDNALVSAKLIDLVSQVTVGGKQIHDANVVATMQIHNIPHLLTHNLADFARFAHLITVLPLPISSYTEPEN